MADLRGIINIQDPVKHRAEGVNPGPVPQMPGYSFMSTPDQGFGGILPSGGQFTDTAGYKDGQSGYDFIYRDQNFVDAQNKDILDKLLSQIQAAPDGDFKRSLEAQYQQLQNKPLYTPGGSLSGFNGNFSYLGDAYNSYALPDKIIPGQFTQTVAQSVGPAQFFTNGQYAVQGGPGTAQTSKPFSAAQPSAAPTQQATPTAGPQGFYFGNNGSAGFMPGTFGGSDNQAAPFYSQQPSTATQSPSNLGILQPVDPKIRALMNQR